MANDRNHSVKATFVLQAQPLLDASTQRRLAAFHQNAVAAPRLANTPLCARTPSTRGVKALSRRMQGCRLNAGQKAMWLEIVATQAAVRSSQAQPRQAHGEAQRPVGLSRRMWMQLRPFMRATVPVCSRSHQGPARDRHSSSDRGRSGPARPRARDSAQHGLAPLPAPVPRVPPHAVAPTLAKGGRGHPGATRRLAGQPRRAVSGTACACASCAQPRPHPRP